MASPYWRQEEKWKAWGLLVPHNAAAAKLRQLLPALMAALEAAGHPVPAIRVKVLRPGA